ncbi:sigma-70 family RNA polymerase sigma factor [Streptomyces sp. NPDC059639]|uniref:sigma-70 family RNA polymerase sigma factor n=1 Tax=Streptomyces sp. NPDC059639 TaxID=3346891 RepID=UPI0036A6EC37
MSARHSDLTSLCDEELSAVLRSSCRDGGSEGDPAGDPPAAEIDAAELGAQALAELYRRHRAAVLARARQFAGDHSAEDLASEAFLRTVRAVRRGSGPAGDWRPYLLTVVRNTAAEYAKAARAEVPLADFQLWSESLPDAMEPEGVVLHSEETRLLIRGFRSLPERWQSVLWQRLVNDRSTADVAHSLGLTPNGVTSLLGRAQEGLRSAYLQAHVRLRGDTECRYYAGLLGEAVRSRGRANPGLTRHLAQCAPCSTAFADLENLNSRLKALAPFALLLPAVRDTVHLAVQSAAGKSLAGKAAAGGLLAVTTAVVVGLAVWSGPAKSSAPEGGSAVPAPTATPSSASGAKTAAPSPGASKAAPSNTPSREAPAPQTEEKPEKVNGARIKGIAWGSCVGVEGDRAVSLPCDDPRTAWRRGGDDHFRLTNVTTGRCLDTAEHYDRTSFNGGGIWAVRTAPCAQAGTWSVPGFSDHIERLVNDATRGSLSTGKAFGTEAPTTFIAYGAYTGSADQSFPLE